MRLSVLFLALFAFVGGVCAQEADLNQSYESLKQAVAANDVDKVMKLAADTCAAARKLAATPAPEGQAEKEDWKKNVAYAKDMELYSEYAYTAIMPQVKPEEVVQLAQALEAQNPKSKYLDGSYDRYFYALNQTGAAAKIPDIADKAVANLPQNEDVLAVVANSAMAKGQMDKALAHADRLVAALSAHGKPEGVAAADWEKKKASLMGQGLYMAGMVRYQKAQYYLADKNLKAALPYLKGNPTTSGAALLALGVSNYQLGKAAGSKAQVLEAAKLCDQAAALAGAHQQQAYQNAQAMRREAAAMR